MNRKQKRTRSALLVAALLLSTSWCNGQETLAKTNTPPPPAVADTHAGVVAGYTIGNGDVLNVQVWKEKDLSQTVVVRPDGRISLPLLGEMLVNGKEPSQVEGIIQTRLKEVVVQPRVTVTVVEIHSRMVYITGEIARPGAYPLNVPITVLQLIAQAGGLTEFAHKKIHVIRGNANGGELWLNYKAMTQGTDPNRNVPLNPGDTVVVS